MFCSSPIIIVAPGPEFLNNSIVLSVSPHISIAFCIESYSTPFTFATFVLFSSNCIISFSSLVINNSVLFSISVIFPLIPFVVPSIFPS